ncbi:MAG: xanthine dehydrogenase family protein molybdopterin-binding subunit [Beijerinckiaceae bacterium]|nr:xanthine dehydrogenase family protein molybdopterin-binding subunit [Beijerinckiaceae bacterium]
MSDGKASGQPGAPYVGQRLKRPEDLRFVTGRGNFVDDMHFDDMAYVAFVRSPHASARIRSVDTRAAAQTPGVLRVVTAADWTAAGHGELTCVHPMNFTDGRPMNEALRPPFAIDRVCHVGDVVAAVVGETRYAAMDGAEAVAIDYDPLPSITQTGHALDEGAVLVHPHLGTNLVTEVLKGDAEATRAAFARAAHVTELTLTSTRIMGSPLEPHAFVARHDVSSDETTLWATNQMPHMLRQWICQQTLHIPEHKLRVIAPDVGGSFGSKGSFLPEVSTIVWMARELGRPVKWTATRGEDFLTQTHGRDHVTRARMAFDRDGLIVGMEVDTIAALGAYLSNFAPSIPGNSYPQTITGFYRTPALSLRVRCVYTNTVPIGPYRGSGRPEAALVNERLLENAAHEMGVDVADLRRRNLLDKEQFPYRAPVGRTFDGADPPRMLERVLEMAQYKSLHARIAAARAQGRLMGVGLAGFFEKSGSGPSINLARSGAHHGGFETATVRVHSDGRATLFVGTHNHGQGHEITYAAIAADRLGIPVEDISVVEGDTGRVAFGNGTWGSRSTSVGGAAIFRACETVMAKARTIAAHMLECGADDLAYAGGVFSCGASNRTLTFAEIATQASRSFNLPKGMEPNLECTLAHEPPDSNDPSAIHLAVVEIARDTGEVRVCDYFTVDDCGTIINPMIVEGQVRGGLAQGIGQALMEQAVFDPVSGQFLTGSFLDYAMPRADDIPPLEMDFISTPAPSNPLGVKGGSETGTIGAPAAICNAVVDALWSAGVRNMPLPMTSATVWRVMKEAGIVDHG